MKTIDHARVAVRICCSCDVALVTIGTASLRLPIAQLETLAATLNGALDELRRTRGAKTSTIGESTAETAN